MNSIPGNVEGNEELAAFYTILHTASIWSVYQPIVSLKDGTVFGYEALTRGPEQSGFRSPLKLFRMAEQEGKLYELDKLAREKAIRGCRNLSADQKIFINIPASVILEPDFTPGQTMRLLRECGLNPTNVVLEITERTSVENFEMAKRVLEHYRKQGYQIAIDDAGAGYSSLEAIAELQPDYIKIDRSLTEQIHTSRVKEYIVETFVTFATKMNISLIAEGIERLEDLDKLMRMGVHYVQGYLLGRPDKALLVPDADIHQFIQKLSDSMARSPYQKNIGDLAAHTGCFKMGTPISEVSLYLRHHEAEQGIVVVDSSNKPVGLMMREKLFQELSGQYGIALFWSKPVEQLMDNRPLILDEHTSLERASKLAMAREMRRLYDLVIITREGKLQGTASVRSILEHITHMQMEAARVSNPLTGLPGNREIQREIRTKWSSSLPFAVIYADLDHFKWYNDHFGFQQGDEVIQYTASVLRQTLQQYGTREDFIGHIGGDDFIALTCVSEPEQLCKEIVARFESGIDRFYHGKEIRYVLDREGRAVEQNGVTLSISLIICTEREGFMPEALARTAAELKSKAKALKGNAVCVERLDRLLHAKGQR
ncbi:bifunctional diguanylate cyclase/phosphodiesterase [Xylanibacillus composti]|uniref:Diguanylate cyclase/phosphodiesterase n=1 Tax=Xylanibacillus composti TaxID=1572762 RepID=A0A8J4M3T1_9BACL|nr:bifunctional diguanylate cyclase/phosphodiesterase [Xylanibacillus composti]GIQ69831.1 hypothetical protein XYCOK13_26550 [Xylanibacillus composti]